MLVLALAGALIGGASRVAFYLVKNGAPQAALLVNAFSFVLLVGCAIWTATVAYQVAMGMNLGGAAAWAVGVLIGGILAVLVMSSRAREWCERHDLRFGLLGPSREDIDRFATGG